MANIILAIALFLSPATNIGPQVASRPLVTADEETRCSSTSSKPATLNEHIQEFKRALKAGELTEPGIVSEELD
jgi:hypothetical protein